MDNEARVLNLRSSILMFYAPLAPFKPHTTAELTCINPFRKLVLYARKSTGSHLSATNNCKALPVILADSPEEVVPPETGRRCPGTHNHAVSMISLLYITQ